MSASQDNSFDQSGSIPLFDGFPYLATRIVPGVCHIALLSGTWPRDLLLHALARQVAANQFHTALVLGADEAFYLPPAAEGPVCGPAPRSDIVLAGGFLPAVPVGAEDLSDRPHRLAAVIDGVRRRGGFLLGDLTKGGRKATEQDRARLGVRHPREDRRGLERCATCGDWRGECLDVIAEVGTLVVPVHCQCDNVTCCARCGDALRERRVGGNQFNQDDRRVWHWPGFMALAHRCALAVETDALPAVRFA